MGKGHGSDPDNVTGAESVVREENAFIFGMTERLPFARFLIR
jgi:hypothetical protein